MASPAANLFGRLHKWAARQDENFLTESLAVVLENLLALAPAVGARLVDRLTGGLIDLPAADAGLIEVRTQVVTDQGRPDLEIRIPHRLAWVEVKTESVLHSGQLTRYRAGLGASGVGHTRLVLLTRYPEAFAPDDTRPDAEVRWFQIADWLEGEIAAADGENAAAGFLARQLLAFLRTRGMTFGRVEKYMPDGVRALSNLMNMLAEVAENCDLSVRRDLTGDYLGFYSSGQLYWFGVTLSDPGHLGFTTWKSKIDPVAAARLGVGEVSEEDPATYRWRYWVELDSEDVHFFARSKVSQVQWLEEFLRGCLTRARSVEVADQTPAADGPTGPESR